MTDIRFTDPATIFIASTQDLASDYGHSQMTPLHLAVALLDPPEQSPSSGPPVSTPSPPLHKITTLAGGNPQMLNRALKKELVRLPSTDPPPDRIASSPAFSKVLRAARDISALSVAEIDTWHLVCAVAKDTNVGRALQEAGISQSAVDDAIKSIRVKQMGRNKDNSGKGETPFGGSGGVGNTSSTLAKYTVDIAELALQDKFDTFKGRELEVRRMMTILKRRKDGSILLVGEHGVGKTVMISNLASRISEGKCQASLQSTRLLSLNIPLLTSASDVEIRQNMLAICQAVALDYNSVLVIDDIELLLAACPNIAYIIRPLMSRPSDPLRIIAVTTPSFHTAVFASSPLSFLLQTLSITPLPSQTLISILVELKLKLELHHGVKISYNAILASTELDSPAKPVLPADAINRLDTAASTLALTRELGPLDYEILTNRQSALDFELAEISRCRVAGEETPSAQLKSYYSEQDDIISRLSTLQTARDKATETTRLKSEISEMKKKMEQLHVKKAAAERGNDLMMASDITYYAIPEIEGQIKGLEHKVEGSEMGGETGVVGEREVREVVGWMHLGKGGKGKGDAKEEAVDVEFDDDLYD